MNHEDEVLVEHDDLFDHEMELDVGVPKPEAAEILGALKAAGKRIVIVGRVTDTLWGTRALMSALYDFDLPFDEIDNHGRYRGSTSRSDQ